MFFVGQKVRCVKAGGWPRPRDFGNYGLHLSEIVNPIRRKRGRKFELAFRMSRFRPLRATNIDVFLKMLEPEPVLVEWPGWIAAPTATLLAPPTPPCSVATRP